MVIKERKLNPIEIRNVLRRWVSEKFELKQSDILIDELGFFNRDPRSTVDSSFRADLVLANGRLVGFEIKSEKDTLKRWSTQMNAYTNVFDEVWLCVHNKHLVEALNVTPKHIGVLIIDDFEALAVARVAKKNNKNNVYDLIGLLWREEINHLAKNYEIQLKSRTTKNEAREVLSKNLNLDQVRPFVLEQLKLRKFHSSSSSSST